MEAKIESLLERVEKPARYIGGEVGSVVKQSFSSRVVLSYPDAYEIGTANQALQILYSLINQKTGAWAQRAFCPWPDLAGLMRSEGVPLFSLESWEPVSSADLWGITLQFELTYTNILEMLDLAGVPLRASERAEGDPLVFAGGPCASNPHPVAEFFDFIVIGDGEEAVPELLTAYEAHRSLPRPALLERLGEIDGVWVLALERPARRRVVAELEYDDIPLEPIVPSMQSVHDRAALEVMRGCTRGCRFCLAGSWYRPVRERPVEDVCTAVAAMVSASGYEEASLSSLSTTDYSGILPVLTGLAGSHPDLTVSLPSLRVDTAALQLQRLATPRRGSVTLAPEAGSQRLRDVINKQVSESDIYNAIGEAFKQGCTTVKLYFMIGLPTETEDDILGIIDIATEARQLGRQLAVSAGRVQINVSVSSFVPKAHTPFQWQGMNSREELQAKQELLRRNMPRKQIKLSLHDLEPSLVEGAISRGGDETAAAIEAAWRAGARFDAWSEKFDFAAWQAGFAALASSVEEAAGRTLAPGDTLPWDDIDCRISQEFLQEELERARQAEITPDCRWGPCSHCAICDKTIKMRIKTP